MPSLADGGKGAVHHDSLEQKRRARMGSPDSRRASEEPTSVSHLEEGRTVASEALPAVDEAHSVAATKDPGGNGSLVSSPSCASNPSEATSALPSTVHHAQGFVQCCLGIADLLQAEASAEHPGGNPPLFYVHSPPAVPDPHAESGEDEMPSQEQASVSEGARARRTREHNRWRKDKKCRFAAFADFVVSTFPEALRSVLDVAGGK
jgi:hypothetical protein